MNDIIRRGCQRKNYFKDKFPTLSLSSKEAECAYWASKWLTNKEIGVQMEVSPHTVASCLERLKKKLGCYNKHQLIMTLKELYM